MPSICRAPRSIPLCIQHHIQLVSLSFQVSRPSYSWDTLFQYYTLKIQDQGWGERWKSQYVSNILSTHIPFVPCQSAIPFLRYDFFFKIWPWKSKVKVMGRWTLKVTTWVQYSINSHVPCQSSVPFLRYDFFKMWKSKINVMGEMNVDSHNMGPTFYRLPLIPSQSAIPFLRYDFFKIWPWKSKVKVMVEVKVKSQSGCDILLTNIPFFHVSRPSHSWDTAFSKFYLENPRSRSWGRWTLKFTTWVQHSIDSHPFRSMWIGHPIPEIWLFQNLTLKM